MGRAGGMLFSPQPQALNVSSKAIQLHSKLKVYMKKAFLNIPFLLFGSILYAQTERVEFKVIDSLNLPKQELYVRARSFIAYSFKNSKNVIQMDDKEAGKIICKGSMTPSSKGTFGITYQNNVDFTLTVDLKDGKYRVVITDLYHSGLGPQKEYAGGAIENEKPACGTFFIPKKDWDKMKEVIKKEASDYLESFKVAMNKEVKKDDF